MTLLLDTHVLHWWSAEPDRLSSGATRVIERADVLAVSGITWFELAWLAKNDRIAVATPVRTWLEGLSQQVLTIGVTAAIADSAISLPKSFPGDSADRLIYATAVEHGVKLITKDVRLRRYKHPSSPALW